MRLPMDKKVCLLFARIFIDQFVVLDAPHKCWLNVPFWRCVVCGGLSGW